MSFYGFAKGLVSFIVRFGYKIEVKNIENLPPPDKGYVLASNHRSNFDPVFIGLGTNRPVCFMAKEELFKNKFFGSILKKLGTFPVSRGKGDQSAITNAVDVVKNGNILGIFPEGTRSKDGTLKKAKSGAVLISSRTNGDIVPVGIHYGDKILWRRRITITYGKPISNEKLAITDTNRNELKAASQLLMERIGELI